MRDGAGRRPSVSDASDTVAGASSTRQDDAAASTPGALRYRADADAATAAVPDLTDDQRLRLHAVLAGPTVSLHEHPARLPDPLTADTWARHMATGVDVLADRELARSGLDVVVAHCFSQSDPAYVVSWARSMAAQAAAADGLRVPGPAEELIGEGVAVLLGLEDLGTVRSAGDVEDLRALGVVSAGLAYNHGSLLGGGLGQAEDTGLTRFGVEAVRTMERVGMVVDASHAGRRTTLDAVDVATRPVVLNHVGAAALWPSARMVADDVIRAVADTGGVIGIEAAPGSTRTDPTSSAHSVADVVRHVEHCAALVGVGAVAIGADTFLGDHVGLYRALGVTPMAPDGAAPFDGAPVRGADHPGEVLAQVAAALLVAGWTDDDVAAVIGGNALRVLSAGRLGA